MKLLLNITLLFIPFLFGHLQGQNTENKARKDALHEARFYVYNYNSKAPVYQAVIYDKASHKLGMTDANGTLVLTVPSSTQDLYTVKANGFTPVRIKLSKATRKYGDYEVMLPEANSSTLSNIDTSNSQNQNNATSEPDLVKMYVKQDPSTYQKTQNDENPIVEFAVQLSATSRPITDKSSLKAWEELGPVYIHTENGLFKVRIGPFDTQDKAKQVLLQAKEKGKKDAFIVIQHGLENFTSQGHPKNQANENDIVKEVAAKPSPAAKVQEETIITKAPAVITNEEVGVEYKVRLASYLKPGGFNTKDIDQYGPLESYRQGEWTIMLIGGFKTAKDAERVRDLVIAKGFTEAAVVVDRGGILESDY